MPLSLRGRGPLAWLAFALLVALAVADIVTTRRIISSGGGEGNPFVSWLMSGLGPAWMLAKVLATAGVGLWILARWDHGLAKKAMLVVIAMMSLVVGWHTFLIVGGFA